MTDAQPPGTGAGPAPPLGRTGQVALRRLQATPHLCLSTYGAYWKLSGAFARLHAWMADAAIVPAGAAMGVFYDDPAVIPPEACRYSICYPLGAAAADLAAAALAAGHPPLPPRAEAPGVPRAAAETSTARVDSLTVETLGETTVAAVEYAGPAAESPAVYEALAAWVQKHGLTPTGPPREVYLAEPGTLGTGRMHAEVQQPVLAP